MIRPPRVHVIGGGFSGLMTAFFCLEKGFEVSVSEADHWGGLLATETTPWGMAEAAANGFLRTDLLNRVASSIGVDLLNPLPGAKQRWIANEEPQTRPVSLLSMAGAGLRYFGHRGLGSANPRSGELLSSWGTRVLGSAVADRVLGPALQGIYGLESSHLSASLVLNPVFRKGRAKRRGFAAPRHGMHQWSVKLRDHLRPRGVRLREERITEWPDADHVVVATSAAGKCRLLQTKYPELAQAFAKVQTIPMISVSTFWEKSENDLQGFGVLFNQIYGWKPRGVLFNEQIFEGRGPNRSERYFFAGVGTELLSDSELLKEISNTRDRLGWKNPFLGFVVHRWPQALPHYSIELEQILGSLPPLPAGLHLAGNELGEIGLTGLAEKAEQIAQTIGGST